MNWSFNEQSIYVIAWSNISYYKKQYKDNRTKHKPEFKTTTYTPYIAPAIDLWVSVVSI